MRHTEENWVNSWTYEAILLFLKCGVIITELLPETTRQSALWGDLDRERRDRVMENDGQAECEPWARHGACA